MAHEDFTTYTFSDADTILTITADTILYEITNFDQASLVYKDKGVNHFDGDFEHFVDYIVDTNGANLVPACWILANNLRTYDSLSDSETLIIRSRQIGNQLRLHEYNDAAGWTDSFDSFFQATQYYLKVKRDEAVGADGTIYCYIYSDSIRATLLGTMSLALHDKYDFRYIYPFNRYVTAPSAQAQTGRVSNLDLQEAETAAFLQKINII